MTRHSSLIGRMDASPQYRAQFERAWMSISLDLAITTRDGRKTYALRSPSGRVLILTDLDLNGTYFSKYWTSDGPITLERFVIESLMKRGTVIDKSDYPEEAYLTPYDRDLPYEFRVHGEEPEGLTDDT